MKTDHIGDIEYAIVRSTRRTADIVIERDGRILVRAPRAISHERIADIVRSKQYWIRRNLAEWQDLNATRVVREYCNGEGFMYLGRSYRLRLVSAQDVPLMLKDGRFCLQRDLVKPNNISAAQIAFREFYTERGRDRIARRVHYYAPKVGTVSGRLAIRDLGHRWASRSPNGHLAFHWKCVMAPLTVIDYIVVHELCHAHQQDHTDAFWNEVDKVLPHFQERKEWLRKHGSSLDV